MGLDMTKFKAALDGNKHKAIIDADVAPREDLRRIAKVRMDYREVKRAAAN